MRRYSFVTVWCLEASVEEVWDAIADVARWPEWWPSVLSVVELEPGAPDGVGRLNRFTWRGRLPYRLTFDMRATEVARPHRLAGVATGELQGSGTWTLESAAGQTRARYDWNVETTKAWMNALAPLLEPAFRWNHDTVMRLGGRSLAKRLESRRTTR